MFPMINLSESSYILGKRNKMLDEANYPEREKFTAVIAKKNPSLEVTRFPRLVKTNDQREVYVMEGKASNGVIYVFWPTVIGFNAMLKKFGKDENKWIGKTIDFIVVEDRLYVKGTEPKGD